MTGITDPTNPYFKDGAWGWDGTQWRKLALLWGYSAAYREAIDDDNADAGSNTLASTAVPAGSVYVIQLISAFNNTTNIPSIELRLVGTAGLFKMQRTALGVAAYPVNLIGEFVLEEGDYVQAVFFACVAGDDIRLRVWGYEMKVTE